jgi:hypothetical protein
VCRKIKYILQKLTPKIKQPAIIADLVMPTTRADAKDMHGTRVGAGGANPFQGSLDMALHRKVADDGGVLAAEMDTGVGPVRWMGSDELSPTSCVLPRGSSHNCAHRHSSVREELVGNGAADIMHVGVCRDSGRGGKVEKAA